MRIWPSALFSIGLCEASLDQSLDVLDVFAQALGCVLELWYIAQTLGQGHAGVHKRSPASQQVLDAIERLVRWRPGLELAQFLAQVAQDQPGISRVGLGAVADAIAIPVEPIAIEQIERKANLLRQRRQGAVVGACGLER